MNYGLLVRSDVKMYHQTVGIKTLVYKQE